MGAWSELDESERKYITSLIRGRHHAAAAELTEEEGQRLADRLSADDRERGCKTYVLTERDRADIVEALRYYVKRNDGPRAFEALAERIAE